MQATFKNPQYNGYQFDGKEKIRSFNVVAIKNGKFHHPITVCWYASRYGDGASPVYCSIWAYASTLKGGCINCSGKGKATGYGYDKFSAALGAAIESAGIELSDDINGRGESAITEALETITRKLGFRKFTIVREY